jgi:hypothetical protein
MDLDCLDFPHTRGSHAWNKLEKGRTIVVFGVDLPQITYGEAIGHNHAEISFVLNSIGFLYINNKVAIINDQSYDFICPLVPFRKQCSGSSFLN